MSERLSGITPDNDFVSQLRQNCGNCVAGTLGNQPQLRALANRQVHFPAEGTILTRLTNTCNGCFSNGRQYPIADSSAEMWE